VSPKQTIAHYRITAKLGEGGMGEVWRATDTKLGRDVALKILPVAFAADTGRMARFEREAKILASLNHPYIAAIYGVEEQALVMELVEGESPKGPMPFEEAWKIALQIADALEYAHERGVMHRDLKPANVKVTPDGVVKLLDFGLAKAFSETPDAASLDPENSPTITLGATVAGTVMGTAAYMSPEQAKGKRVDKRADIWSWGVMLYELLTGERPFRGDEAADTLAQVLTKEPNLERVPLKVRRLLGECLQKDPKQRLRDIGDARRLLLSDAQEVTATPPLQVWRRPVVPWSLLGAVVLIATALVTGLWRGTRPTDRPLMWLSVDLGPDARASRDFTAAISPDGTRLVFPVGDAGPSRLAVRSLGQPNATPLAGTEGAGNPGEENPFFSPDGEWVAFGAGGKLKKISIHGGPPMTLCDGGTFHGGAWGEDGFIVAALGNSSGLSRVPENGGSPQPFTKLENDEVTHRWPQFLPGRKAVLFSANNSQANWEEARVEVLSLKTGQRKTVVPGGFYGRYLPSGHLVYLRGGTLYGMAFDIDRLEPTGPPAALLEGVAASNYGGGQFDFSRKGTLVYLAGNPIQAKRKLVWIDAAGKTQPFFAAPDDFNGPALSPDGKRLAIAIGATSGIDLWVYDLEREIPIKLPTGGNVLLGPIWAPDGKHLVYGTRPSSNNGVMWIRADGGGEPQQLTRDETHLGQVPNSVSPNGRFVIFGMQRMGAQSLIIDTTDPDHPKAGAPEPLLSTSRILGGTISPDGRWFAYTSPPPGTPQIFVRPFADGKIAGNRVWPISAAGGAYPVWSRAESQPHQLLYATSEGRIMVVDYTVEGDSFRNSKPRLWTDKQIGTILGYIPNFGRGGGRVFDLTPDGRRIIAWEPQEAPKEVKVNLHVTMLQNWFDELRRRLPPSGK
jgi:serine/threonine-protein kinase